MEFKRNSVVTLYLEGKTQADIVRALKHLDVNKAFVSRTIARYKETGSVAKRYGGGRQKTASVPEIVEKVKDEIERNPQRSARKLAADLQMSTRTLQRILKNELKLKRCKIEETNESDDQNTNSKQHKKVHS